jgi:hypothetical protein
MKYFILAIKISIIVFWAILFLNLFGIVHAHDHGLPNWITKKHPSCCGEDDCFRINMNDVSMREEGIYIKATGEVIPYKDVKQSEDGEWWRCVYLSDPKNKESNKTRCLFLPTVS